MIVGLSLGIMVVITIFSIILGGDSIVAIDFETQWVRVKDVGTKTSIRFEGITFSIDELEGMLIIITIVIALSTLIGIRILASGLSDSSIKIITVATSYGGIWAVLSVLCYNLITSIEIFGSLLYISLTIAYVIGIVQKHIGV